MPAELTGIDAIRKKHEWWVENNELHVQYTFDATFKPTGQRQKMTEMALYTVKDGKSPSPGAS